ncbi:MAG: AbrB/MazE/SpoVT family DNA-binding domain-containing protein [Candidatus Methanospirareceae archaeon]
MSEYIVKVGKRGELYTPKKLRLEIGLATGDELVAVVEDEAIILRKRKTVVDLLEAAALATISDDELKEERRVLEKELLER